MGMGSNRRPPTRSTERSDGQEESTTRRPSTRATLNALRRAFPVRLAKPHDPNEIWPDLDVADPIDGEAPRAVQALLVHLGVTRQVWWLAKSPERRTAAEFARAVLRMGPTVEALLFPSKLVPEYAAAGARKRAKAKLKASIEELEQKSTGTQSVRELVRKYALDSSAREVRDAMTLILEPLKRRLRSPNVLNSSDLKELNARLYGVLPLEPALRRLKEHGPLVHEKDLSALKQVSPRKLAIIVTRRAFGDLVSEDELRRSKPKRAR